MQIRNIAIIAHVDHGKTTLVDKMLRQAGAFRDNQVVAERVMDSNPLERERGITILAKNTAVRWKDTKINIVDTPGHADFGGEVERILRMVDGVFLVVDAFDGPMPQTRFQRPSHRPPRFATIGATVPEPPRTAGGPFQMLITTIDHSPYLGRMGIGRIERGTAKVGDRVALLPLDPSQKADEAKITRLFMFE